MEISRVVTLVNQEGEVEIALLKLVDGWKKMLFDTTNRVIYNNQLKQVCKHVLGQVDNPKWFEP